MLMAEPKTEWPRIGSPVVWRHNGREHRTCVISEPTYITRSDGTAVACVALATYRLVPIEQLSPQGEHDEAAERDKSSQVIGDRTAARLDPAAGHVGCRQAMVERKSEDADHRPRALPDSARYGEDCNSDTQRNSSGSLPAERHSARFVQHQDRSGEGNAGPILAIDFLNLLVRAWHAGKPSESHAIRGMCQTVASAIRAVKPSCVVFAMDGGHTHRSQLLPQYKAHRPPSDPDLVRQRALAEQAIQIAGFQTIRIDGWEADDVLASIATRYRGTVICSSDKDLLALADRCRIYHPWSGGSWATPEDKLGIPAGQVTDYLALCGDTSDGIPGVPGIGPKSAAQLLEKYDSIESILTAAKLLHIPGATGKKLRDHAADALLCRSVVQLNTALQLPELEPWSPRALWQKRLTDMRLGNVAAIVDGLVTSGVLRESIEDLAFLEPQENGKERYPSLPDEPPKLIAGAITRSITEPIRTGLRTVQQIWDGPDKGLIYSWEQGRQRRADENPWKRGTDLHLAWHLGNTGQDLYIVPTRADHLAAALQNYNAKPAANSTLKQSPARPVVRSLFD